MFRPSTSLSTLQKTGAWHEAERFKGRVEDFLPAPEDLVPREDNVKVTLALSRRSLDFFKREAKKRHVPYQRMIRALVDTYAERQVGKKW